MTCAQWQASWHSQPTAEAPLDLFSDWWTEHHSLKHSLWPRSVTHWHAPVFPICTTWATVSVSGRPRRQPGRVSRIQRYRPWADGAALPSCVTSGRCGSSWLSSHGPSRGHPNEELTLDVHVALLFHISVHLRIIGRVLTVFCFANCYVTV